MYDFDKTLSPKDMQEFSFIPSLGIEPAQFWSEVTALSESQKMDGILTYMYMMLNKANLMGQPIRRSDFVALGKNVKAVSWGGKMVPPNQRIRPAAQY